MTRDLPLPDLGPVRRLREGSRRWPIDSDNQLYREPLVAVEKFGLVGRNHYAHVRNPPYWMVIEGSVDMLLVRESVARMLAAADSRLAEAGLRLFLHDAWRPRAVQAFFYDQWMPRELIRRRPDLQGEALQQEISRYWAAPTMDPSSPAPHETGGAVDLSVVWRDDGQPLWMGSLFDDPTSLANTDHFEHARGDAFGSFSDEEARANRRLLYHVMTDAGFMNHPDEWWHYSFGDQMWAKMSGRAAAHYGPVAPGPDAP
jgi:D-alanyl-D-alanine dipeptidase